MAGAVRGGGCRRSESGAAELCPLSKWSLSCPAAMSVPELIPAALATHHGGSAGIA
jgi:hypothetical protein